MQPKKVQEVLLPYTGLSHRKLAALIGVSHMTVKRWRQGKHTPRLRELRRGLAWAQVNQNDEQKELLKALIRAAVSGQENEGPAAD